MRNSILKFHRFRSIFLKDSEIVRRDRKSSTQIMDRFTEIGESTKLLISKHHKDPKNLYPFWPTQKSSMLVINDYEKIIRDYDSNRKWVWNNQMTILGCLNIASNLWICYKIRRYLNLHSTMKGFFHTLIPSTVFSVFGGIFGHLHFVSRNLIKDQNKNPSLSIAKSGALHWSTSTLYPSIFLGISSIYIALRSNTFIIPDDLGLSRESRRYILKKISKPLFEKNKSSLILISIANIIAACLLATMEYGEIREIFLNELILYESRMKSNQNH
ncbi:hypothetical protein SSS_07916 [Sarcoptes scabiei]|uniref:Uncharacterized protein n=1 Tax=Sarcoptes scabiei TaxID=52283 RepID=A0A834VDQ7_SARSC|nr:hypothetical protein SSS_07916 [Sarcoptes scabiei]